MSGDNSKEAHEGNKGESYIAKAYTYYAQTMAGHQVQRKLYKQHRISESNTAAKQSAARSDKQKQWNKKQQAKEETRQPNEETIRRKRTCR